MATLALGNGTNGGVASNYTLTGGTHTASVTQKSLTASLVGTVSKTYDGTTTVTNLENSNFSLTGLVGSELPTINKTTGTYASKDVGSGDRKSVV